MAFFSTIIASFVLDISPWPEHSSFGVKVETLLVDLVIQACELSHHESINVLDTDIQARIHIIAIFMC